MSHSSSDSSLLHRNRPSSLAPQRSPIADPHINQILEQRLHLETHEARHLPEPFVSNGSLSRTNSLSKCMNPLRNASRTSLSPSNSMMSSTGSSAPPPVASTSSGLLYLNQDPTLCMSFDNAQPDRTAQRSQQLVECCAKLQAAKDGVIGELMPREQWQPDCSSALCSEPFCTTIFAPSTSYFNLGPRRHHCRNCGRLYCSTHSSSRALFYANIGPDREEKKLVKERVCDGCMGKCDLVPLSRHVSLDNESEVSTDLSDTLITPGDSSYPLSRSSTRLPPPPTTTTTTTETPADSLAPVQAWMDRDGVISLYPLALPSNSRRSAAPAAGPLFAPSQAAKRLAREQEQRIATNLRQRRLGKEPEALYQWVKSRRSSVDSVEEEAA